MDIGVLALFLPLLFGGLLIFFVVLFVFLARSRKVEHPGAEGWGQASASAPWGHAEPTGRWNGEILGNGALGAIGGTAGSTFGVFEVRDGTMTFTPDGAAAPDWTTPCTALVVAKRGFMSFNGADVSITWPTGPQRWHSASVNVSRERINRVMENDFKDLRERGYADEFVACLAAHGARVNG